jgi:hypothetical protein
MAGAKPPGAPGPFGGAGIMRGAGGGAGGVGSGANDFEERPRAVKDAGDSPSDLPPPAATTPQPPPEKSDAVEGSAAATAAKKPGEDKALDVKKAANGLALAKPADGDKPIVPAEQRKRDSTAAGSLLWEPVIPADAEGEATLSFEAPKQRGVYWLLIDAHGQGRFGAVWQRIEVE